ncbi:hypothetical protein WMF38_57010 [Sorangium sp. So ce118]
MSSVKTWRYYLPSGPDQQWAEVVLVSTGMFAAVSDWGNYAFAWRGFGDCFRKFVIGISDSPGYVMSKVSREEYDGEATEAVIKKEILRLRRAKEITAEQEREFWDELDEHGVGSSEVGFALWYYENRGSKVIEEAHSLGEKRYPHAVRQFCQRILPRLAEVLRAELEAEKRAEACALGGPMDTHAPGM